MIDLAKVRRDTSACERVLHFNNAGAALMPDAVVARQVAHIRREGEIGGYEAAAEAAEEIDGVYRSVAALLNAAPGEIALMENATLAWNAAFFSFDFQPGDRLLTGEAEYASNYLNYLKLARSTGLVIEAIPSTPEGELSIPDLEAACAKPGVKLITVTHVPTNGGLVNPAEAIGRVAKAHGIPFLLDACQSAGQIDLDVEKLGCDLLSATGRKYLRGPRGSGFLYVRRGFLDRVEPPALDLRAAKWVAADRYELRPDAKRFENWEYNYAAVLGLGTAVDYARAIGLPAIEARVADLAAGLRARLAEVPGVTVQDIGRRRCGLCVFEVAGQAAEEVKTNLRRQDINTSVTDPNSTLLDATKRALPDLVRASVHYYNSDEELDRFAAAVKAIAAS
ncbi:aminotransferase class V-fold PLP-dependent enzyme [Pelagibius sp.]|uniref:aminotransferase class V-fold PLP-dependent enzyme n=1 Tax=Pelagibius sp. TaxID=1931238 RepID=UPI00261C1001|nr:aminotransferase class V-fold PLP-dependent enzyme [Pelagibius sp.]